MIDNKLYEYMHSQTQAAPRRFVRYAASQIDWDSRLVGILGPRGVGKSTMILQRINTLGLPTQLYVSADHLYFVDHPLHELVDDFVKEGGTHLYIDEVHKYKGWSRVLKQAYDVYPKLHIVFTGSSVLDLRQGESDLSRRALMYHLQGLSFREYLELFHHIKSQPLSLPDILSHQVQLPPELEHPLPLFRDYLHRGYYPFALEDHFPQRLQQVVQQTLEVDIPQYADMKASTARKLKHLLILIAQRAPYKPVADHLATLIGVSKNNIPDYLDILHRAGMIGLLRDDTAGLHNLAKIEKAYIDNPTLQTILANGQPDIGNLRETFFYNQIRLNNPLTASRKADFAVAPYTFEVGGRKKGKQQIEGLPNAFIVKDDIEYGHANVIPLWHFGMNY